ncbi:hypothetical protein C8R43DRAFT_1106540 [Mycena crocata]|nr:hypothetical protein C8R43DRAFT_1106540 [Mycena crocata]
MRAIVEIYVVKSNAKVEGRHGQPLKLVETRTKQHRSQKGRGRRKLNLCYALVSSWNAAGSFPSRRARREDGTSVRFGVPDAVMNINTSIEKKAVMAYSEALDGNPKETTGELRFEDFVLREDPVVGKNGHSSWNPDLPSIMRLNSSSTDKAGTDGGSVGSGGDTADGTNSHKDEAFGARRCVRVSVSHSTSIVPRGLTLKRRSFETIQILSNHKPCTHQTAHPTGVLRHP